MKYQRFSSVQTSTALGQLYYLDWIEKMFLTLNGLANKIDFATHPGLIRIRHVIDQLELFNVGSNILQHNYLHWHEILASNGLCIFTETAQI